MTEDASLLVIMVRVSGLDMLSRMFLSGAGLCYSSPKCGGDRSGRFRVGHLHRYLIDGQ